MSLRHNIPEMIAEKLPARGNRIKQGIDHTGLRKRPQMEQIVDYLENGQERVKFPDREAKFIRNHPFMTQLDFFDMQEDQERAWEDQKREHEAQRISKETQRTAAEVRTEGSQTDKPKTFSRATDTGTQFFDISDEHEKMTSDEKTRQEQQKEHIRRKVEHNLGESPGTIPYMETRASSSQGYSSMHIQGPKISMHHRVVGEQAYTSQTTQGPHVEQNLKREQYYTSETTQGPSFTVQQNLKREQGYTSTTTAKKRIIPRMRLRKRRSDDTDMPDSSAGQQAPKRSASAHPEEPEGRKPTPNAPKMEQPSASASSSGPDPAASSAPTAKKGENKKKQVKKDNVKESKPRPNPAHATELDKSNDLRHWERQTKAKLVDQITKRGYRGDMRKLVRMKVKDLAALIVTLPIP